jgi:hypothetical protein
VSSSELNLSKWAPYCANPRELEELKEVLNNEIGKGALAMGVAGSRARAVYNERKIDSRRDLDLGVLNPHIADTHERRGSLRRLNKRDWSVLGILGWSRWIDVTRFNTINPEDYRKMPTMRSLFLGVHWMWVKDKEEIRALIISLRNK